MPHNRQRIEEIEAAARLAWEIQKKRNRRAWILFIFWTCVEGLGITIIWTLGHWYPNLNDEAHLRLAGWALAYILITMGAFKAVDSVRASWPKDPKMPS